MMALAPFSDKPVTDAEPIDGMSDDSSEDRFGGKGKNARGEAAQCRSRARGIRASADAAPLHSPKPPASSPTVAT